MHPKEVISYNLTTKKYRFFSSVLQAATKLKLDEGSILRVLSDEFKQTGGYTFCETCANYEEIIEWKINQPNKRGLCHQRKVIATDLNGDSETYDSATEAAKLLGVSKGTVSLCCKGLRKHKHFTFKWA